MKRYSVIITLLATFLVTAHVNIAGAETADTLPEFKNPDVFLNDNSLSSNINNLIQGVFGEKCGRQIGGNEAGLVHVFVTPTKDKKFARVQIVVESCGAPSPGDRIPQGGSGTGVTL